jgi:voltage-gated sodium channel
MADIFSDISLPANLGEGAYNENLSFRKKLRDAFRSKAFDQFLTSLIVIFAITLALLSYLEAQTEPNALLISVLKVLDISIFSAFCAELLLKIYAFRGRFFTYGWNIFDFAVILISIIGMAASISTFRAIRVFRTLRIVTNIPSMRKVIESFLRSLPGIASVIMVMVLMLFVFALIGQNLYSEVAPDLFGTLHASAFTLFTVLTLEGWPDVSRSVMEHVPSAWLYFVSFIAINSFVVLNLMIAVIIEAMHKDYDEEAEEEREDILFEVRALRRELAEFRAQQK